jgi:hypothetical protein
MLPASSKASSTGAPFSLSLVLRVIEAASPNRIESAIR